MTRSAGFFVCGLLGVSLLLHACSSAGGGSGGLGGGGFGGTSTGATGGINVGGSGGIQLDGGGGTGGKFVGDPKTCAQAAEAKTYIGCDFWPTPVTNHVWSLFDFAVVVANAGDQTADVSVERGGAP